MIRIAGSDAFEVQKAEEAFVELAGRSDPESVRRISRLFAISVHRSVTLADLTSANPELEQRTGPRLIDGTTGRPVDARGNPLPEKKRRRRRRRRDDAEAAGRIRTSGEPLPQEPDPDTAALRTLSRGALLNGPLDFLRATGRI